MRVDLEFPPFVGEKKRIFQSSLEKRKRRNASHSSASIYHKTESSRYLIKTREAVLLSMFFVI
jgi:hypothetical protein